MHEFPEPLDDSSENPQYHQQPVWDQEGMIIGYELILDEAGQAIPSTICICHALEPNECVCGAWDDVDTDDWYRDDHDDLDA